MTNVFVKQPRLHRVYKYHVNIMRYLSKGSTNYAFWQNLGFAQNCRDFKFVVSHMFFFFLSFSPSYNPRILITFKYCPSMMHAYQKNYCVFPPPGNIAPAPVITSPTTAGVHKGCLIVFDVFYMFPFVCQYVRGLVHIRSNRDPRDSLPPK